MPTRFKPGMRRLFTAPAGRGRRPTRAAFLAGALAVVLALLLAGTRPDGTVTATLSAISPESVALAALPPASVAPRSLRPIPAEPAPTDPEDYAPPNLIFIMADDLGRNLLSRYDLDDGVEINTPNIDRLADEGVLFKNAWATPLCLSTRAELITGQYPFNNGTMGHSPDLLGAGQVFMDPKYQRSFAQPLQQAGYATAMAGKWHNNNNRPGLQPRVLAAFGFNEWMTADPDNRSPSYSFTHQGGYTTDGFPPDVLADFVIDFIARHRSQPFFVYYPMHLVHRPLVATPLRPDAATDTEKLVAMTEYADHLVGRLLLALEEMGLRENTIIFFSGDNGTAVVELDDESGMAIRAGGKGKLNEAGINVPFIVSGGPVIQRGETDALTDFTDVMPTLAEFAGVTLPDEYRTDGQSIAKFLTGQAADTPRRWIVSAAAVLPASTNDELGYHPFLPEAGIDRYLWNHRNSGIVVRNHRFKLWDHGLEPPAIFDLHRDPQELVNLWDSADPEVAQAKIELQDARNQHPLQPAPLRVDPYAGYYGMFAHWRFDRQLDVAGSPYFPDTIGGYDARTDAAVPADRPGQFGSALPLSALPPAATSFERFFRYNKWGHQEGDPLGFTLSAWVKLDAAPSSDRLLLSQPARLRPDLPALSVHLIRVVNGVEQTFPLATDRLSSPDDAPPITIIPDGAPRILMVNHARQLAMGQPGQLTVVAYNLNPAHRYLVRVDYGRGFSLGPDCAGRTERSVSAIFGGQASYAETFTLYGCPGDHDLLALSVVRQDELALQLATANPVPPPLIGSAPGPVITAGLRQVASATESDPPLVISSADRPAETGPRLSLYGADRTPALGATGLLTVTASSLDPSRDYMVWVDYGDFLASSPDCEPNDRYNTSAVFSGRASYTKTFTVHGCHRYPNFSEWTHVAATWDRRDNACGEAILYIDGKEVSRSCLGAQLAGVPLVDRLQLGYRHGATADYLDDLAVWRQALPPAQVAALYTLGRDFGYDAAAVDSLFNTPRDYPVAVGGRQWHRTALSPALPADLLTLSESPDGSIGIQFGDGIAIRSELP